MELNERLNNELDNRKLINSYRELKVIKDKVDFSSNDYLGFAQNEDLKSNIINKIKKIPGIGSGGSRLLTGNNIQIEILEKEVAEFHMAPAALFFNSGYEANSGLISTITKRNDTIIYDELIHASLREGIRLSNAQFFSFRHNDLIDLEIKLQKTVGEKFVIIESVYSMDGDLARLNEIVSITKRYKSNIILDEAHATGVIGNKGEGLAQHLELQGKIFARVHTCGKAIGNNGAFVLGSDTLKNYLINFCRPFIYSTAPNLMQVIAVAEGYRFLKEAGQLVAGLKENCIYFKQQIARFKNIQLLPSASAIFSILIPGNEAVKLAANYLQNENFDIRPILSPTVAEGSERLRVCMHSFNTKQEIDELISFLENLAEMPANRKLELGIRN